MISAENGSGVEYVRPVMMLVVIAVLGTFITISFYVDHFVTSYGQQTGSLALVVVHTDGSPVDPKDFLPGSGSDTNGYYSLYDNDDEFVGIFPACNLSTQEPCEANGITPGSYTAIISLDFGPEPYGEGWGEYSESIEVEEGGITNLSIPIDIGHVEASVTDTEGNELDPLEFVAWYTRLEGYYTIYDAEGNFVVDVQSCNIDVECTIPLSSGIYEAIVSNPNDPRKQITPFEVVESATATLEVILENGDPSAGTGSDNGGNGSDNEDQSEGDETTNDTSSAIAKPQREPIRLLNYTNYIDNESGFYRVVGEIQNIGTNPAKDITIHGIFYDGDEIVALMEGYSVQDVLAPGAISPFEIEIKSTGISLSITNYTLTVPTSERTTHVKQQELGLNITRQYYDSNTGLYHLEGIIVNYSDGVANFVRVIATAYDQQNRPVYVTSKYTNSHLNNGIPSTFEIVFTPPFESQVATVSAIVESDEFSMVPQRFLKSPITVTLGSSTYDNGMFVEISGNVGSILTTESFALVEILWPDGIQEDSELVRISPNGSYSVNMQFFSQPEYLGETFTVRVSYGIHYSEEHFQFAQSCVLADLWVMIVESALDDRGERTQIEQCLSSLASEAHDSRIVTPSSPLRIEATNRTGAKVEFSVTLAPNGTSGFDQPLCIPRSGSEFPLGNSTVSCIVGDRRGNSAVSAFIVSVQDNTPPQIIPPPDVSVELLPSVDGTVSSNTLPLGFPVVFDLVDPSPSIKNNAPDVFAIGQTIVVWTSSDASGNTATANQTVFVTTVPEGADGKTLAASSDEALVYYETNYSVQAPNASNPVVFQPEFRLYRPAQNVNILGLVHESLLSTFADRIASMSVRLLDEKGDQVGGPTAVTIDPITGEFSSTQVRLPQELTPGLYKLQSEVNVDFEKARTVMQDDSKLQELESLDRLSNSRDFVVGNRDIYFVNEEGQQYKVQIASNAYLCCNRYSNEEKKMAFESIIANASSINTVAEVAVPKFLLDGQIRVFIDGQVAPADSVVLKNTNESRNSSMTIFEVNYGHGAHTIEIYGTSVVPEFPLMSYLFPTVAIMVIISGILLRRMRFHHFG